jgi:hypothetical protein
MESAVQEFWRSYVDTLPPNLDRQRKTASVFSFGDSRELAEELACRGFQKRVADGPFVKRQTLQIGKRI